MRFGHLIGESRHADMDLTFHVDSEMASLILNFAVSFVLRGSGSMVPRATNSRKSRGLVIGLLMCNYSINLPRCRCCGLREDVEWWCLVIKG